MKYYEKILDFVSFSKFHFFLIFMNFEILNSSSKTFAHLLFAEKYIFKKIQFSFFIILVFIWPDDFKFKKTDFVFVKIKKFGIKNVLKILNFSNIFLKKEGTSFSKQLNFNTYFFYFPISK